MGCDLVVLATSAVLPEGEAAVAVEITEGLITAVIKAADYVPAEGSSVKTLRTDLVCIQLFLSTQPAFVGSGLAQQCAVFDHAVPWITPSADPHQQQNMHYFFWNCTILRAYTVVAHS